MTDPAIDIQHLVKEFTVTHAGYGSLKTRLVSALRSGGAASARRERRRVLDDLSVQIGQGETVGLVGKNGSGKSTLLGLLARIYKPNSGTMAIQGRVAALLEIGAGFHPELTGVENVFFNGTVMGLSQAEIAARFDSIVAFAELGAFMDTPVRNYSLGMIMRLGFSVAVHMDADVILIDEALAVGDEAFQRKCFDKISEFQRQGKTIMVVSHELDHLEQVATRILWLQDGKIVRDGPVAETLAAYREAMGA